MGRFWRCASHRQGGGWRGRRSCWLRGFVLVGGGRCAHATGQAGWDGCSFDGVDERYYFVTADWKTAEPRDGGTLESSHKEGPLIEGTPTFDGDYTINIAYLAEEFPEHMLPVLPVASCGTVFPGGVYVSKGCPAMNDGF